MLTFFVTVMSFLAYTLIDTKVFGLVFQVHVYEALLIAYVMWLQLFDVNTTNQVLRIGGKENSSLNAWAQSHFNSMWWVPKILISVVAIVLVLFSISFLDEVYHIGYLGAFGMAFVAAYYMWVVLHNERVLVAQQRFNATFK